MPGDAARYLWSFNDIQQCARMNEIMRVAEFEAMFMLEFSSRRSVESIVEDTLKYASMPPFVAALRANSDAAALCAAPTRPSKYYEGEVSRSRAR